MESKTAASPTSQRRIFTVSELTVQIKNLLETEFSLIWLTGEISNFSRPTSGHFYFTVKDKNAQIRAVMFRGQNRHLSFHPTDGMQVIGLGRISLYEPRGTYQVIFEYLEPKGVGALQIAFEQLKSKLEKEGLFDAVNKKSLPLLPQKIVLITSATGAVVHDMLRIIKGRFDNLPVFVVPVTVQGEKAAQEIAAALKLVDDHNIADVAIIARGGGSLEDLTAFNSEIVARAVFSAKVPVISAVGHETDFTIVDFVADMRAPTPTAAAEMVAPLKADLIDTVQYLVDRLIAGLKRHIQARRALLDEKSKHLIDPRRKVESLRLRLDESDIRLRRTIRNHLGLKHERWQWWHSRLQANCPGTSIEKARQKLEQTESILLKTLRINISAKRSAYQSTVARLKSVSPNAVLARGYSITRDMTNRHIVRDSRQVDLGQKLEVMLHKGKLTVSVNKKNKSKALRETADSTKEKGFKNGNQKF